MATAAGKIESIGLSSASLFSGRTFNESRPLLCRLASLSKPISFSNPMSKLPRLGSFFPVLAPSSSFIMSSISSSLFLFLMLLISDETVGLLLTFSELWNSSIVSLAMEFCAVY